MNIEEIKQRIEDLQGCVVAQGLALQVILAHHPEALKTLRSVDSAACKEFSTFRQLSEKSTLAAKNHLSLLQNPLD